MYSVGRYSRAGLLKSRFAPLVRRCLVSGYFHRSVRLSMDLQEFDDIDSGVPPLLDSRQVCAITKELFPFDHVEESSVRRLDSYDDKNYYFRGVRNQGRAKEEFVLKINNSVFSHDVILGLNSLTTFLTSRGFCVPHPLSSRGGRTVEICSAEQMLKPHGETNCVITKGDEGELERVFCVRVLAYIPGDLMDLVDKRFLTPKFMYSLGNFVGRLHGTLKDFTYPAINNRVFMLWDLQHLLHIRKLLPAIDDEQKRAMAEQVLCGFEEGVIPHMSTMKRGIIHGDVNGMNVLVTNEGEEYIIKGFIDFGDCLETCLLFELAITIAYSMVEKEDPVHFTSPILSGYLDAFPLPETDLQCLYYSVLGRMVQSAVIGEVQYKRQPWNKYLLTTPSHFWKLIQIMLDMGKEEVEKIWVEARKKEAMDYI